MGPRRGSPAPPERDAGRNVAFVSRRSATASSSWRAALTVDNLCAKLPPVATKITAETGTSPLVAFHGELTTPVRNTVSRRGDNAAGQPEGLVNALSVGYSQLEHTGTTVAVNQSAIYIN